jgi:Carboxypeptidase regulatory-like domain
MTYKPLRFRCLSGTILVVTLLFLSQPRNILAQDAGKTSPTDGSRDASSPVGDPPSSDSLPYELQPQSGTQTVSPLSPRAEASASISGVVQDMTGAAVAGAEVRLTETNGSPLGMALSDANGAFTFGTIPPGSYRVMVNAKDFESFQSAEIVITAQQAYEIPGIVLRVAAANTHLTVRPTEEVAAEQVKAQEQQRIIGIVPNFYTSYIYDAAPLTKKQKYSLVSHNVFDPIEFLAVGINAGIGHATNRFPGYEQGAEGYGKRYAAAFGDAVSRNYLSYAVLPSLFHQDPRYFYQGSGSTKSRLVHAVSFTVVLRGDNGRNMPNYSFFLGSFGSALLSNLYYPHQDRGARLVFTNVAVGFAARAGVAVLREFVSKRFTSNVPGNGKP